MKQIIYCILLLFVAAFFLSIIANDFISSWENNRLKEKIKPSFNLRMTNDQAQLGLIELSSMTIDQLAQRIAWRVTNDSGSAMTDLSIAPSKDNSITESIICNFKTKYFIIKNILPYSRNSELHYNLSRYCEKILDALLANKNELTRPDDLVGRVTQNNGKLTKSQIPNPKSTICNLTSNLCLLAISECQKAILLNPVVSNYYVRLAQLYNSSSRVSSFEFHKLSSALRDSKQDIVAEFERSIFLNPNHDYPHHMYANWLFDEIKDTRLQKSDDRTQSDKEQLRTPNSELPTPNSQLSTHNIFREYKTVLSLNPSLTNEILRKFMSITHDYSELKRLLIDTPENHYKLAVFLQGKGFWRQNIPAFLDDMERARTKISNPRISNSQSQNAVLSIFPYYKALASGLMKDGEKKKAIELLREYIEKNRKSADRYDLANAHFWIADWAFYGGRKFGYGWNFVKYHHLKAIELDTENESYRLWYAIHLIIKKEYEIAIEHLNIILKENPEHADARFRLGQCYEGLGRLDIARKHYKKAISLSPDNNEYIEHYNKLLK